MGYRTVHYATVLPGKKLGSWVPDMDRFIKDGDVLPLDEGSPDDEHKSVLLRTHQGYLFYVDKRNLRFHSAVEFDYKGDYVELGYAFEQALPDES
jgi:hypothetical protein